MNLLKNIVVVGLLFLLLFSSCGTKQGVVRLNKSEKKELDTVKYNFAFIEGEKQFLLGNDKYAKTLMNECLRLNPEASVPYYNLAKIEYAQANLIDAKIYLDSALKRNSSNKWYYKLLIQILVETRNYSDAINATNKLIELEPENVENYLFLSDLYLSNNNYKEAVSTYVEIENIIGFNQNLALEKIKLYDLINENKKAKEELLKLIDIKPDVAYYYGLLAEFYIEEIEYEKALMAFQKVIELDPENGLVHLSLYEFYMKIGEKDKALEELTLAINIDKVPIENKIQAILNLSNKKGIDSLDVIVNKYIDKLVKLHPGETRARLLRIETLIEREEYDEARNILVEITDSIKNNFFIWQQLMLVENFRNDNINLRNESEEALEYFPNQGVFYFFNGIAHYNLKSYNNAISILLSGLDYTLNNIELKRQIYTYLAESYYRKKEEKKAYDYFDLALEINENDTYILNNYSYYLALEGNNLEKAKVMMKRCLTQDSLNSSYLDTYAWVLYKQNKFQEAINYIDLAYKNGGSESAVILEHYGDILFKSGNKNKAIEKWQQAEKLGGDSEGLWRKIETGELENEEME